MKIDKNKLLILMVRKKWDFVKLSEVSGVRKSTISRAINSHYKSVSLKTIIALADALEVDCSEFIVGGE